jgi:hypothetical protein
MSCPATVVTSMSISTSTSTNKLWEKKTCSSSNDCKISWKRCRKHKCKKNGKEMIVDLVQNWNVVMSNYALKTYPYWHDFKKPNRHIASLQQAHLQSTLSKPQNDLIRNRCLTRNTVPFQCCPNCPEMLFLALSPTQSSKNPENFSD